MWWNLIPTGRALKSPVRRVGGIFDVSLSGSRADVLALGAQVYPPDRFWDEMKKRGWNVTSGGPQGSRDCQILSPND